VRDVLFKRLEKGLEFRFGHECEIDTEKTGKIPTPEKDMSPKPF
jgi:hypothetical protein